MNTDRNNSKAFSCIKRFITELSEQFGEEHRPVALYAHLLSKTTPDHAEAISKNVKLFYEFAIANRDAIYSKDVDSLVDTKISYSEKVYVDISEIFKLADAGIHKVMWIHILLISALVDPTGKAKQVLKEDPKKESTFMSGVLEKIEKNVDPNADPKDALGSMMSSGLVGDIMSEMTSGLQNGEFDIGGLMGSVQNILKGISPSTDGGETPDIAKMMDGMMKGLTPSDEDGDGPPDLAKMMEGMMKGLSPSGGGEGVPDLAKMMDGMMKGLSGGKDGEAPDLGKMLGGMMGGGEGGGELLSSVMKGQAPDLSKLAKPSGVELDEAGLPIPPKPNSGDPLKMIGQLMGAPQAPKSKPTRMPDA